MDTKEKNADELMNQLFEELDKINRELVIPYLIKNTHQENPVLAYFEPQGLIQA